MRPSHALKLAMAWLVLSAVGAASAGEPMRDYSQRMEALFRQLDRDGNGRLDRREVKGQKALKRRLQRQGKRSYLLLKDLRGEPGQLRGQRLVRRFKLADADGDRCLSRAESSAMPWVAHHFAALDRNRDGHLSLQELLALQAALAPSQRRP